jgi:type II secretory pathway pseudopilin PulG
MNAANAERKRDSAQPQRLLKSEVGAATSLLEAALVIAIVAVVSTVALVGAIEHIDSARLSKAAADTEMIGIAIQRFMYDIGWAPVFKSGDAHGLQDPIFFALESSGNDAVVDPMLHWPTDKTQIDQFENQLVKNTPGGGTTPYPRQGELSYSRFKGWNGPYITMPTTDPWGDRYLANVQLLTAKGLQQETTLTLATGQHPAIFVVSAGPNKVLETKFDQIAEQFVAGGDDIIYRIQ